ncbi:hypothetical protein A4X17_11400 [Plantibacter sp. H53]|uniref:HNH endonuclease n=1 Tax=Plantibacter sp. H53 TaxID=1827323 RepID=UPI0007D9E5A7|nr:HNH endonuclease [Plantibacter sp. H53]OAN35080.1 hypothetical protein A4X17_11400 [Plantibacter sp. H53]
MKSKTCTTCGETFTKQRKWSYAYFEQRKHCSRVCRESGRASILTDFIVTESGCWEWQGLVDKNGYGRAYDASMPAGRRIDWAHRVSYRLRIGPIPENHELDHTCENTVCMNPAHLDPVTRPEHVRRTIERAGGYVRQQEAAAMRHSGMTYAEIAEAMHLSGRSAAHARVQSAINNGLVDPSEVPRVRRLDSADHADIRDLYALGIPQSEIASWYRTDNSQISRICNGLVGAA